MIIFLVKILIKPIQDLTVGTRKIAAGIFDYRVPITTSDEFKVLANSFNSKKPLTLFSINCQSPIAPERLFALGL